MEREKTEKSCLIEYTVAELELLEQFYWTCCLCPDDLIEIPRCNRGSLKNFLVASRYFDCVDARLGKEAQELQKVAEEHHINRKAVNK